MSFSGISAEKLRKLRDRFVKLARKKRASQDQREPDSIGYFRDRQEAENYEKAIAGIDAGLEGRAAVA